MIGNQDLSAQNAPENHLTHSAGQQQSQSTVQVQYSSLNDFVRLDSSQCKLSHEQIYAGQITQAINNEVCGRKFIPEELQFMAEAVFSANKVHQFVGVVGIRKIISSGTDSDEPIIQQICEMNLVPHIVELLTQGSMPGLQYQAAWALTNMTSSTHEHAEVVCQNGAVTLFTQLLQSPHKEVQEQVLWGLGNIAGDSDELRDMILEAGTVPILCTVLEQAMQTNFVPFVKNGAWVLSNLARTKPIPPFQQFQKAVPILFKIMQLIPEPEVQSDSLWALSYLSEAPGVNISLFIHPQYMHILSNAMTQAQLSIVEPAQRIVGQMSFGSDEQVFQMMQAGMHLQVATLLDHSSKTIRKVAAWVISNYTACGANILSCIIESGIVEKLIHVVQVDEQDVKKEALWALANFHAKAELPQMLQLLEKGVLKAFIEGIKKMNNTEVIRVSEEAILSLLKKTKNTQHSLPLKQKLKEEGGVDRLEGLFTHPDQTVQELAVDCVSIYEEKDH